MYTKSLEMLIVSEKILLYLTILVLFSLSFLQSFIKSLKSNMSAVWNAYRSALLRHPNITQVLTTGGLLGVGDVVAQSFVEKKNFLEMDYKRTCRFFAIGSFFLAPVLIPWYKFLQNRIFIKSYPKLSPIKRVAMDQLLMGPILTTSFMFILRTLEDKTLNEIFIQWRRDFPDIFKTGLMIWPAVQLVNFYLLPLHYRIIFVQTVAILWNTYFSWRLNLSNPKSSLPSI